MLKYLWSRNGSAPKNTKKKHKHFNALNLKSRILHRLIRSRMIAVKLKLIIIARKKVLKNRAPLLLGTIIGREDLSELKDTMKTIKRNKHLVSLGMPRFTAKQRTRHHYGKSRNTKIYSQTKVATIL